MSRTSKTLVDRTSIDSAAADDEWAKLIGRLTILELEAASIKKRLVVLLNKKVTSAKK